MSESNGDKEFYRDIVKEMVSISKDTAKAVEKNNKLVTSVCDMVEEIKLALQNKPCIAGDVNKIVNKGWMDSTVKIYRWVLTIIGSLFCLSFLTLVLLSIGKEFIGPENVVMIIKYYLKMP